MFATFAMSKPAVLSGVSVTACEPITPAAYEVNAVPVTCKVPPLKTSAFAAVPRLSSTPTLSVPAFSVTGPEKE